MTVRERLIEGLRKRVVLLLILLALLLAFLFFYFYQGLKETDLIGTWRVASNTSPAIENGPYQMELIRSNAVIELQGGHHYQLTIYPGIYVQGIWHLTGNVVSLHEKKLVAERAGHKQEISLEDLRIPDGIPDGPDKQKEVETAYSGGWMRLEVSGDRTKMTTKYVTLERAK